MKRILLFCICVLAASVAVAQQSTNAGSWTPPEVLALTNSASMTNGLNVATNSAATDTFDRTKAEAEKGDAIAQGKLGAMYFNGSGVTKDTAEAVKWLRKAASQGNAPAQALLSMCYMNGEGTPMDQAEGVKWLHSAAEGGVPIAQCMYAELCKICSDDPLSPTAKALPSTAKNMAEAVKWYRRAAEQGYADAQFRLGGFYLQGNGVPKDYVEAYKWFDLASAQDNAHGKLGLSVIENLMTPDQIAEAQELARKFKPHAESGSSNSISPDQPVASGTGFFITDDGYLISNYHVVKDASQIRLVTSAGTIPAKVVQVDAANDLALLKANAEGGMQNAETFKPLPIISSRGVKLGGTVATVGFPDPGLQGFAPKLAKGEIAALSGAGDDARYFQISAPVQPGNSGGALVDAAGNVVGIVSAKLDAATALAASGALPENVNYAVKSSFLLSFLESVPGVEAKLKKPNTQDEKFEDVVKQAQDAAVLVLVY